MPQPTPEVAMAQVERLLVSTAFRTSKRCISFLRFAAEHALKGQTDILKERQLGVELFGRPPGYDTNEDTIVRNTAGEVRKRLAQYYQEPGRESELRVELPVGTYVPHFTVPAAKPEEVPVQVFWKRRPWVIGEAIAGLAIAAAIVTYLVWPQSPVDAFWAPVTRTPGPVLICLGTPLAFNFSSPVQFKVEEQISAPNWRELHANDTLPMRDLLPMPSRYITLLDAIVLSRITSVLSEKSKPFHIRGVKATSFTDIRENATVLIGAFSNDWTLKLDSEMRYYFWSDPVTHIGGIRDRQNPSNQSWTLPPAWPEWNLNEDYAIVSRVFARDAGRVVVTAAGISQYGTNAAGEFVTNPDYLREALKLAPKEWKHQNLEFVLGTKIVAGVPGPPRILASHFW
jgi:hypothetical protein